MKFVLSALIGALLSQFAAFPSLAAPINCEAFRDQLWKAIDAAGDKVAQPRLNHLAYQRPDGTLRRYEMAGIVGLQGSLRCSEKDRLEAFSVSARLAEDEGVLRTHRLTALGAATICAVVPTTSSSACKGLADKLAKSAVKGFSQAHERGEEDPSDFQKKSIGGGYGIEFDARDSELSFNLVAPLR